METEFHGIQNVSKINFSYAENLQNSIVVREIRVTWAAFKILAASLADRS